MKKIYQKPAINIVKVQVNNILTVSDFNENPNSQQSVNGSQALGRAWYEWDD